MENKPFADVIGTSAAPYETKLAAQCGLATNYHAVTHPSLPNYIAATSGSTQGIGDDNAPASHPLAVASIYSQVKAAGKTWRDYEESAPGNCPLELERPVCGQARSRALLQGHPLRLRALGRAARHDVVGHLPQRPHEQRASGLLLRDAEPLQRHP